MMGRNLLGLLGVGFLALAGCQAQNERVSFGRYEFERRAYDEVVALTREVGFPLTYENVQALARELDLNQDGRVGFDELEEFREELSDVPFHYD
ncbi:MAG: EF-hand domain-containing protein [archaeon]